jgi:hypothetical protein
MWVDIEKSVVATIKKMAVKMRSKVNQQGGFSNTFFELWRWDFIVSKDLGVFLAECNMSPNLMPKHFS